MTQQDYISAYSNDAVMACLFGPFSPGGMLAEAALESGNGNSTLASQYNNHFGIKASSDWTGPTVDLPTPNDSTAVSTFRVYDSAQASFKDRNDFLKAQPRYADALNAPDAETQIGDIAADGYAEDPNYAAKIDAIISANGLDSLDQKKKSTRRSQWQLLPCWWPSSSFMLSMEREKQLRINNYKTIN